MGDVVAVLVLPEPKDGTPDPHGLVAGGQCGARPPTATRVEHRMGEVSNGEGGHFTGCEGCGVQACRVGLGTVEWKPGHDLWKSQRDALALAWDGKQNRKEVLAMADRLQRAMTPDDTVEAAIHFAKLAEAVGWGTALFLDADGLEVTNG